MRGKNDACDYAKSDEDVLDLITTWRVVTRIDFNVRIPSPFTPPTKLEIFELPGKERQISSS
jgi:hypothetical protein